MEGRRLQSLLWTLILKALNLCEVWDAVAVAGEINMMAHEEKTLSSGEEAREADEPWWNKGLPFSKCSL